MAANKGKLWLSVALLMLMLLGTSAAASAHPRRAARFIVLDPFWYSWNYPYYPYGFGPYPIYRPAATTGAVELRVSPKEGPKAQLYVNGALAAEFTHKKTLRLAPGEYRLEVRKAGYASQSRSVYVTADHKLKLELELAKAS